MCVWGEGERGRGSPLSLSISLLFSLSLLSSRSCRLSSLSNDHSSSRALSLSVPECLYFGSFPVWPNLFVSKNCANLVPLGMKWAALCWKWVMCLCLFVFVFVFGCVSMC